MAGLNKTDGEILPGLGKGKPVSVDKWADVLGMAEVAALAAAANFKKVGAPTPISFSEENVLVQEFHFAAKVVWTFQMDIKGETFFYHYTFDLGPQIIPELVMSGKWPAIYLPNFTKQ
jgi:hypothetical protein